MGIVIKLTGRVFNSDELINRYADIIAEVANRGIVIVTGGGDVARRYIEVARKLTGREAAADMLGIWASRLNAMLMMYTLLAKGVNVYLSIPETLQELGKAYSSSKVIVMGGLQPGQSTTMVSVLAAEYLGINTVVNCSNIDALYTDDPSKNPNAARIERARLSEVEGILSKEGVRSFAGTYELIDEWALQIMRRSGISMIILDGKDPGKLTKYLKYSTIDGTLITP
ncbi:UMP kinase [Caldivirga sp. UBA161]|uniref:UMP kinase n=1 Tax=Caldivirga sp. UBA161 TaxID=1915569 RepID=UPI0025BB4571|nr:UMP kinase [Caldivirga sp. UBA161]